MRCMNYDQARKLGACSSGLNWFAARYPNEYVAIDRVLTDLFSEQRYSYALWLCGTLSDRNTEEWQEFCKKLVDDIQKLCTWEDEFSACDISKILDWDEFTTLTCRYPRLQLEQAQAIQHSISMLLHDFGRPDTLCSILSLYKTELLTREQLTSWSWRIYKFIETGKDVGGNYVA